MDILYKLYLKESPLGLKYLGKTIKDPFEYMGSGTIWKRHIKKYNLSKSDIKTTVLLETTDKEYFKKVAIEYSDKYNVVESDTFANIVREEGDGGTTVTKQTKPEVCKSHSERMKKMYKENPQKIKKLSDWFTKNNPMKKEELRKKVSNSLKGHSVTNETREKISNSLKKWMSKNENSFKGKSHSQKTKEILSKKRGHSIILNGVQYRSIRHASEELGISRYNIKKKVYGKNILANGSAGSR